MIGPGRGAGLEQEDVAIADEVRAGRAALDGDSDSEDRRVCRHRESERGDVEVRALSTCRDDGGGPRVVAVNDVAGARPAAARTGRPCVVRVGAVGHDHVVAGFDAARRAGDLRRALHADVAPGGDGRRNGDVLDIEALELVVVVEAAPGRDRRSAVHAHHLGGLRQLPRELACARRVGDDPGRGDRPRVAAEHALVPNLSTLHHDLALRTERVRLHRVERVVENCERLRYAGLGERVRELPVLRDLGAACVAGRIDVHARAGDRQRREDAHRHDEGHPIVTKNVFQQPPQLTHHASVVVRSCPLRDPSNEAAVQDRLRAGWCCAGRCPRRGARCAPSWRPGRSEARREAIRACRSQERSS